MQDFYKSKAWEAKRKRILRLDGYRDAYVWRRQRIARAADTVHHIYPRKEYPQYALEDWNLISVSRETHNALENRATGELTAKGIELMRRTVPGKDWRTRPSRG